MLQLAAVWSDPAAAGTLGSWEHRKIKEEADPLSPNLSNLTLYMWTRDADGAVG